MSKNSEDPKFPSQEQLRKMFAALWPELSQNPEAKEPASSEQNHADALSENEIDELLEAIEPSEKEDVLSPEEMEELLDALAQGLPGANTSKQEAPSSPPPQKALNEEETKLLLKTIGAIKQAEQTPPPHQSPLTEDEVEKLIKALSQES